MTKNPAIIQLKNISKAYKLYERSIDRLIESLTFSNVKYHKEHHVLNNISFMVSKGESLGIIGKNGHGKSTLLKIIAGVLSPTLGQCYSKGRISAILELTSNLRPEMTGLENIEFNLKITGFNNNEIKDKFNEIEEFADIGEFIKQPVKLYSSGMKSRLGFAIATANEPDILILDEVLSVGDFNFQQKCLAKLNSMREEITIIFVSHSMNSVRQFCDRVIVLEEGNLAFDGKPKDAVSYYLQKEEENKDKLVKETKSKSQIKNFYGDLFYNKKKIYDVKFSWNKSRYKQDDEMILDFSFKLYYEPINLIIGVPIWDEIGNMITSVSTDIKEIIINPSDNGLYSGRLILNNIINPGKYVNVLSIYDGQEALFRQISNFETTNNKTRFFGYVTPEHNWHIDER